MYRFTSKLPATGQYKKYGAFHTGEVAYAYGNLRFVKRCPWQPVDYSLEKMMSSYWANFVATGNPNGKGLPQWPAYNIKSDMTMMLGENSEAKPLPDKESLNFLISTVTKKQDTIKARHLKSFIFISIQAIKSWNGKKDYWYL